MEVSPFIPYKLLLHSDRIAASLRGELVYPVSVELDLSNTCPHDCPFCSFGTSQSHGYRQQNWVTFPYPRILELLKELKDCGVKSITFTGGGEPLVHPQVVNILACATSLGLEWGVVTNGVLLMGDIAKAIADGAKFCRVSLDAGTARTHKFTHGTKVEQFGRILDNMRALRELAGPRLVLGSSFCAMQENVYEIEAAVVAVRDVGANYLEVRPTFPTDWRGDGWGKALTDHGVEVARILISSTRKHYETPTFKVLGMVDRFDALDRTGKQYSKCLIGPLTTVIGADARIWHCCVQRGQDFFNFGSVADRPFPDVWAEIHASQVRDQIDISKCPRCRYDGYNKIIEEGFINDRLHGAFV